MPVTHIYHLCVPGRGTRVDPLLEKRWDSRLWILDMNNVIVHELVRYPRGFSFVIASQLIPVLESEDHLWRGIANVVQYNISKAEVARRKVRAPRVCKLLLIVNSSLSPPYRRTCRALFALRTVGARCPFEIPRYIFIIIRSRYLLPKNNFFPSCWF